MGTAELEAKSLTEQIPNPEIIRQRLADNLQESRLLRQLLRVAERAAKAHGQQGATR